MVETWHFCGRVERGGADKGPSAGEDRGLVWAPLPVLILHNRVTHEEGILVVCHSVALGVCVCVSVGVGECV